MQIAVMPESSCICSGLDIAGENEKDAKCYDRSALSCHVRGVSPEFVGEEYIVLTTDTIG